MLFDAAEQTDDSPRAYTESSFAHLGRRPGEKWARNRALMDEWLARLPPDAWGDVAQRIRSGDDDAFHAAFFEIYIHELLLRTNHSVALHPVMAGTKKRPDFLATHPECGPVIVECRVCTETSDAERREQATLNSLYDAINDVNSPDFFLNLDIEGAPRSAVPQSKWCAALQRWLGSLDYDRILATPPAVYRDGPMLELEHDGLRVVVRPIPKRSARGTSGIRSIGMQSAGAAWVTSQFDIRNAIKKKVARYGSVAFPYIVAVNGIGSFCGTEDIELACFGNDGLWRGGPDPQNTRLSAVLATQQLFPWCIDTTDALLLHNPDAARPYVGALNKLPQARFAKPSIERIPGTHPHEIFAGVE